MELGFETVGNATLIVHDRSPVLVTDPWLGGPAYFGSWAPAYEIPAEQTASIAAAPFVWFSHGHPDHLHPGSLRSFHSRRILLADHVGGRIASDLRKGGFDVTVLKDNEWVPLSERVRVLCLADYNQDSVLLVDVGGTLVVNLNDSVERGWGPLIRSIVRRYPVSFALKLSGYGDADMINFVDEEGSRLPSGPELRKEAGYEVGAQVARSTDMFGCRYFVPFSSFHRYQRSDSAWANACTTPIADMGRGYRSKRSEILPAFIRHDCVTHSVEDLNPAPSTPTLHEPDEFGDNWGDDLSAEEQASVTRYFASIEHLQGYLDFVNVRVGNTDLAVAMGGSRGRGVTFHVPRHSLLKAIEWEIFDDLLIGNFMRTTLHGSWPESRLSSDVTPYIAKYADNGRVRTHDELDAYFSEYRQRMGRVRYFRHSIERHSKRALRSRLPRDSATLTLISRAYQRVAQHT